MDDTDNDKEIAATVINDTTLVLDVGEEDFVKMMRDEKWIETSRGDTKRPGAYCTGFSKSRTPRVYLSDYNGGSALLLTLAHELGHAFHSWVTRDLPQAQLSYPMNLAETASIFFETLCYGPYFAVFTVGRLQSNLPNHFRFAEI